MTRIKGVILSVEGTICPNGTLDQGIFQEVDNLIKYFRSKDIDFVIHTNRPWFYNKTKKLGDFLKERWGSLAMCVMPMIVTFLQSLEPNQ